MREQPWTSADIRGRLWIFDHGRMIVERSQDGSHESSHESAHEKSGDWQIANIKHYWPRILHSRSRFLQINMIFSRIFCFFALFDIFLFFHVLVRLFLFLLPSVRLSALRSARQPFGAFSLEGFSFRLPFSTVDQNPRADALQQRRMRKAETFLKRSTACLFPD